MKKAVVCLFAILVVVSLVSPALSQVKVGGYTRSNGTYVAPYERSTPNSTPTDNYSFKGNVNPYTGKEGHDYYRDNPRSPYYDGRPSRSRTNNLFGN